MQESRLLAPANFSDDRRYRWSLSRGMNPSLFIPEKPVLFCGYNPSVANASDNDPTIRKEIGFTRRMMGTVLIKVNLFAGVATDPDWLGELDDPVGDENDDWIRAAVEYVTRSNGILIAAWGTPKGPMEIREAFVCRALKVKGMANWLCLRMTKHGHPEHPLYLPGASMPRPLE